MLAAQATVDAAGAYRFSLRDFDQVDAVLAPLRAAGLHIEELQVQSPDLEDVFVQVMAEEAAA